MSRRTFVLMTFLARWAINCHPRCERCHNACQDILSSDICANRPSFERVSTNSYIRRTRGILTIGYRVGLMSDFDPFRFQRPGEYAIRSTLVNLMVGPRWYQAAVVDLFWLSDNVKNVFFVPVVFVVFRFRVVVCAHRVNPTPQPSAADKDDDDNDAEDEDNDDDDDTVVSLRECSPTWCGSPSLRAYSAMWEALGKSSAKQVASHSLPLSGGNLVFGLLLLLLCFLVRPPSSIKNQVSVCQRNLFAYC